MDNISKLNESFSVGFWTPYLYTQRGNATTAKRIISGLQAEGHHVEAFAYEEEKWTSTIQSRMTACDVYHVLHFNRFAAWMNERKERLNKPYLVTSGGTDVNEHMEESHSKRLLEDAEALTVFTQESAQRVLSVYPQFKEKLHVIPQSVYIPEKNEAPTVSFPKGSPNVLLPAGLREVKDVFHVFGCLERLQKVYPALKFMIVGESLDSEVLARVEQLEQEFSWFHYAGSMPIEQMTYVYGWADIVLNTSISEGQSIAIMEAMYYGVPVIARANGGNKSLISHGMNGYIYEDERTFERLFVQLLNNRNLYQTFSEKGKEIISREFSVKKEIENYMKIYKQLMR
ncbi:glycosyltransferase family 4 protein [Pseudalkalibacillus sp. SCS-8]|uniref:glycosyltransferase family 4 protein n=1 Tax=Pseudalkalibacillus nanhaiensis TaxID=3115291 RepID=UPI0032DAC954